MNTYYNDPYIQIVYGDCREVLANLPAESVQCVVTSPPYWGLRKYSGEQDLIWGGEEDCRHLWGKQLVAVQSGGTDTPFAHKKDWDLGERSQGQFCSICGAWRGSYGLEPTLEMYIEHTIEILRAIRRVLRKDGVVFWDIGDSYATSPPGTRGGAMRWQHGDKAESIHDTTEYRKTFGGVIKPKDLCLIPERVVIAAQEDGWHTPSVIIWNKPNPMPESVTKRPTKSHDYILLLAKSADYYWDADAVREPHELSSIKRAETPANIRTRTKGVSMLEEELVKSLQWKPEEVILNPAGRNLRSVWTFPTEASGLEMCLKCKTVYESSAYHRLPSKIISKSEQVDKEARNRPLESSIHPYRGDGWGEQAIEGRDEETVVKICRCGASDWLSHFAVFPEKLPEICIKAATPEVGCCSRCGAPYERVISKSEGRARKDTRWAPGTEYGPSLKSTLDLVPERETVGWQPTCKCNAEVVPSSVLDPLAGSGRTGKVAKDLGRKAILIDTSEDYCRLAKRRIEVVPLPMIFPVEEGYTKAPDWF